MERKRSHSTAFYLETLLMILVFVTVILLLTQVFGASMRLSRDADVRTTAVTLSESVDQACLATVDDAELLAILTGNGTGYGSVTGKGSLEVYFGEDLKPSAKGPYKVTIERDLTKGVRGTYAETVITVYHESSDEPVLETNTAEYVKEVSR